jgi:mannose-6-phosphate isomerase-like protein (cupin superfamily)
VLFVAGALGACHKSARMDVPSVTTAHPTAAPPVLSGPTGDAAATADAPAPATLPEAGAPTTPASISFVEGSKKIEAPVCSRLYVVAAKGDVTVESLGTPKAKDVLSPGDVLVVRHPEPVEVKAPGLAVEVVRDLPCATRDRPTAEKTIVRAKDIPDLSWGRGSMRAKLLVGTKTSPELYIGWLEGTAAVPEHDHPTSIETVVALEAAGTFTLDGKESRLGPRQIVSVPKGTKHAWKPDPASKLVAVQLYEPPGPEQRFLTLAAAEKDAGAGAPKR